MTAKRRSGDERGTTEGVDDLAGVHAGTRRTGSKALRDGAASAALAEGLPGAAAPPPADRDRREHRQSSRRKAPGPTKAPTQGAEPTAPPPGAPPPSDPQ